MRGVSTLVSKSKVGAVSNWRVLRSTTTLSYRDGNVGRGFTTVADDAMSDPQLKDANKEL
jgi:hypothetical protein